VCPGRQPGRQAVDRRLLIAVHHAADTAFSIHPVRAPVFVAGIFSVNLITGLEPPKMPVNIIRWSNPLTHAGIVQRIYFQTSKLRIEKDLQVTKDRK
jgi:hypothetical protein